MPHMSMRIDQLVFDSIWSCAEQVPDFSIAEVAMAVLKLRLEMRRLVC